MIERNYPELCDRFFEHQLENGLIIRVIPRPGFAKKLAFLATDFGSIDSRFRLNGKDHHVPDGIAHYLEHKMFDLPEGGAMEQFALHAGSNNAFTNYSMTAYYVECTSEFEENLKILLRMVTTPYFTEQSVEKERGIIAQEIRMYEDSADSVVEENLLRILYPDHPVSIPIAGTVESIGEITAQTLYDCHKAFYDCSNMLLCVIGDVDCETVVRLAKQYTPPKSGVQVERDHGSEAALQGHAGRIEKRMEVSMPTFSVGFPCKKVERGENTIRTEIIGDLAAEVLIGESSRLYQRLYEQNLIDSDFSAGFEQIKGVGFLELSGDSEDPDAVIAAALEEAGKLADDGIDREQFERLRRSMIGRRTRELDSFDGVCYRMSAYFFDGAEYFDYVRLIKEIKAEEVEQFLREVVKEETMAVSVILPKQEREA